jgi:CHAT domain-containing protein
MVWAPVAALLPAGTEVVYICPDGNLSRLPWAALPGATSGAVLLEQHAVAVVPDGPFLLERLEAPPPKEHGGGPVVAVGDVRYGVRPAQSRAADLQVGERGPAELGNRPGEFFGPLPRSLSTGRQVLALAAPRPTLPLLSGNAVSVDRLTAELPQAGWALIYTHGYFDAKGLEDQRRRIAAQLEVWQFRVGQTTEPVGLGLRSPLAYNGLALAGANLPPGELPDGGILSAEAIAALPLGGLRLAVLAACESGLGELTKVEGVRGLVYSFHIAGCPDVLASLWNVDDEAAATVVKLFFHGVWRKNLGPLEALRRAQLLAYSHPKKIAELAVLEGEAFEAAVAGVEPAVPGGGEAARAPAKRWAAFSLSGAGR